MTPFIRMKPILLIICISVFGQLAASLLFAQNRAPLLEFDEMVVRSTFKIQSGGSLGTAFVMLRPHRTDTNLSEFVLITAAHVLESMPSSNATIHLRVKEADQFRKGPYEIPIRGHGTNLWKKHPKADVAAMHISFPSNADLGGIPTTSLADDKFFREYVIHPGDELRVLGYPYGFESGASGFPILRSGRIASYPLTPVSSVPTFLLDFRVFRGNSGGPVYLAENRHLHANSVNTVTVIRLMGLISEEATISEQLSGLTESMVRTHQLGLGVVVHPQLIREVIDALP